MDREIKAAVIAFIGIVVAVVWAIVLFRVVVPLVLEAHFPGSLLVATATGVAGLVGLIVFGWMFLGAVRRLLADPKPKPEDANGARHPH